MELIGAALTCLVDGDVDAARAFCTARAGDSEELAEAEAIHAFADFWGGDFTECARHARAARALAATEWTTTLALAAEGLARAGDLDWCSDDTLLELEAALISPRPDDRPWSFARYLAAEVALVSARIDIAARILESGPPPALAWQGHRFAVFMDVCMVRVAAFAGEIVVAQKAMARVHDSAANGPLAELVKTLDCLILGNAQSPDARAFLARDPVATEGRSDWVSRGSLLLHAYGARAAGDAQTAARLVLAAGGDEGLRHSTIIDRALGLETLLCDALDHGDLAAAASWGAALEELWQSPIAAPSVDRALARLALAAGDCAQAKALAERSAHACLEQGRQVEAAESQVLLARCQIARGEVAEAGRQLRGTVVIGDRTGHFAVRRAATEVLAPTRRRLPPIAGGGWEVLTPAEAEVARRILAGQEIDEIAEGLVNSPRTVQVHVSRVLCAFGVASRIGLLHAAVPRSPSSRVAELTPRQREVAALVARGDSNTQIGSVLALSVKTVEKHISDIGHRWGTPSRFGIARMWQNSDYA